MRTEDSIARFFAAWGLSEATPRRAALGDVLDPDARYADPRSEGILIGLDAIADYVAMFSANAPGWQAEVVATDQVADAHRVTVAFGGTGPDGSAMVQHGQYFVRGTAGRIVDMVGFVGTGAPQ